MDSRRLPLMLSCTDVHAQGIARAISHSPAKSALNRPQQTSAFSGKRVHFIGIGGCGMSGLARILLDAGAIVTGSDPNPNSVTFELVKRGAQISRDQLGELLSSQTDLVVRTAAVPDSNMEFRAAVALKIPTIKYAELLGEVMRERLGIAVAGTHGKSTTTAMISFALSECGADPSFVVGGTVPQLGGGSRSGSGDTFVVEACEFDRSFHKLLPRISIITNVEEDHLDCYTGGLDQIVESFRAFAELTPADGLILANGDDANVRRALAGLALPTQLMGNIADCAWTVRPTGLVDGCQTGKVLFEGQVVADLRLSVPGEHNLWNATTALAACVACGIEPKAAAAALSRFTGVGRRMELIGQFNRAIVVDDYGHHPTEIRVTLKALREKYDPERLICVFQPHQHSRTRFLLDDFATCFAGADQTIVPDIYFVRDSEAEKQHISANDLVDRIRNNGQDALHLESFARILEHLHTILRPGDVMVTMGAGNVWEIARDLIEEKN